MSNIRIPKIQHYVPQLILKNFTDGKKPPIWVFDKRTGKRFKTNIENIASEKGFYDFIFEGSRFTIEPSISDLEAKASKVFKQILKEESIGQLTLEDKALLSKVVVVQVYRTRHLRELFKDGSKSLAQAIRNRGGNPEDIEECKEPSESQVKLSQIRFLINKVDGLIHLFLAKIWVLLKATKRHPFYISDNPISLHNIYDYGFYGNLGLAVRGVEIYLPISKTLTLGMWCPSHEDALLPKNWTI